MYVESEMRENILQRAKKDFFKYGYSKTRVDEIANSLGISKKTIYNHFKGKEDLLIRVIDRMSDDFEHDILEVQKNYQDDYTVLVREALTILGKWVSKISDFTNNIRVHKPDAYQRLTRVRKDVVLRHSINILNKGVEIGHLKKDSKLQMALFMFLATSERMIDEEYHERLPAEMIHSFHADPSERFKTIVNIIYEGLKTENEND